MTSPSPAAISSARASCSARAVARKDHLAAVAAHAVHLHRRALDSGMTTTARSAEARAAYATAWPWLPLDWVITPRRRRSRPPGPRRCRPRGS